MARLFLYTNSTGQLHYRLAFFRIAVRKMCQSCETKSARESSEVPEGLKPFAEKNGLSQLRKRCAAQNWFSSC